MLSFSTPLPPPSLSFPHAMLSNDDMQCNSMISTKKKNKNVERRRREREEEADLNRWGRYGCLRRCGINAIGKATDITMSFFLLYHFLRGSRATSRQRVCERGANTITHVDTEESIFTHSRTLSLTRTHTHLYTHTHSITHTHTNSTVRRLLRAKCEAGPSANAP